MLSQDSANQAAPLRVGSLFSGYGGLDLAVEEVFNARTVWFSEINEPVARVFSHHWPDAPNLGDITTIDWAVVPPIDILCGGFPCQDVSTVGKRAGLAPGTRSGLWAHMATAIEALQPEWVIIENVRGLLSAPATRARSEGEEDERRNTPTATPDGATPRDLEPDSWFLAETATRPLRAAGAVLGDLADLGMDATWIGLPASAIGAPHPRFRVFIVAHRTIPHPAGIGLLTRRGNTATRQSTPRNDRLEPSDHRPRPPRTERIPEHEGTRGPVDVDRAALRRWGRYAPAITRWTRITGFPAPAPALLNETTGPRPSPAFVEWLMGLPAGWVTDAHHGLTINQQITALGNGVLPRQAVAAVSAGRAALSQESR
ncbi:DNA cytosine methyltransferase [Subtercola frigoramans]|uniref:DNA (cytosine-5-)-methyltransferase n=1 Tax=Subtercola frigoramans TaxID=120298 RepID=A0ABS2L6J1_9MICO|nr:DNA cytosine methyltransferase [Subtercola frigoramans]MBM7472521.1 DNA (cytosine-5)-methyltransferase 1 [Subtercola frigoramans]